MSSLTKGFTAFEFFRADGLNVQARLCLFYYQASFAGNTRGRCFTRNTILVRPVWPKCWLGSTVPRTPSKTVDHNAQDSLQVGQYFLMIHVPLFRYRKQSLGNLFINRAACLFTKCRYSPAPHKNMTPCLFRRGPQCWRFAQKLHPPRNEKTALTVP